MRIEAYLAPLCMLLATCGDGRVECVPLREGVSMFVNDGPGVWTTSPRLIEEWRAGGTREGEELGYPITIVASPTGRIAIPDWNLREVVVVEPDGEWLGAWTRAGEGPGEVRHPLAAAWRDDGALVVFDLSGKLVTLRDGQPEGRDIVLDRAFTAGAFQAGEIGGITMQPSGAPVLTTSNPVRLEAGAEIVQAEVLRLDPESARVDTLVRLTYPLTRNPRASVPGWPRAIAAAGGEHLAVAADDGSYRILVYGGDGVAVRQVCRPVPGLPISPGERGEAAPPDFAEVVEAVRRAPAPHAPAAIGRIVVATQGGLWVQRDRSSVFGTGDVLLAVPGALYDVFDANGTYLGEVRAPARARIHAVSDDAVWALETGSFDETWVIRYRIEH